MTIADIKQKLHAGGNHFFDRDTMRWFGSRVESSLYKNNTFITSEYTGFERTKRAYTVRYYDEAKNTVVDVSGFGAFSTKDAAREFAKNYKA
jgi:hypothetical protein